MKKNLNIILFILLFIATREIVYFFYEDLNITNLIILDEVEYFKFSIAIVTLSFLSSFIFLVINFSFSKIKVIWKIATYKISLLVGLFLTNYAYTLFTKKLFLTQIIMNFLIVVITFTITNFSLLHFLTKKQVLKPNT